MFKCGIICNSLLLNTFFYNIFHLYTFIWKSHINILVSLVCKCIPGARRGLTAQGGFPSWARQLVVHLAQAHRQGVLRVAAALRRQHAHAQPLRHHYHRRFSGDHHVKQTPPFYRGRNRLRHEWIVSTGLIASQKTGAKPRLCFID